MVTLASVATPPLPTSEFLDVALAAQESGLEELWLWEDVYRQSGPSLAAALLAATSTLRVGIGVMPVPLRNAVMTAMEIATLEELFPGRVVPGVGHGVQTWMEELGVKAASPLTMLREHVTAIRSLLDGEEVTADGRYVRLQGAQLVWPPAGRSPLFVGAHGPKTLRLVGEVGEGVMFQMGVMPADLERGLAVLGEGRAAAGRTDVGPVAVYVALTPALREAGPQAMADHLCGWVDAGATTLAVVPTLEDGETPDMTAVAADTAWLGTAVRPLLAD